MLHSATKQAKNHNNFPHYYCPTTRLTVNGEKGINIYCNFNKIK